VRGHSGTRSRTVVVVVVIVIVAVADVVWVIVILVSAIQNSQFSQLVCFNLIHIPFLKKGIRSNITNDD
jgi:hypothetical protein